MGRDNLRMTNERGVASVEICEHPCARLQAWIDRVREGWQVDSAASSGA